MRKLLRSRALLLGMISLLASVPCLPYGTVDITYAVCGNPGYISVSWSTVGEPTPVVVYVASNNYAGTEPAGPYVLAAAPSGTSGGSWIYTGYYYTFTLWSNVTGGYGTGNYLDNAFLGC